MSNKIGRIHEKKGVFPHIGAEITRCLSQYFVAILAAALCFIVPLYAKDGYNQIGNAKFEIYRGIMIAGCPVLLATSVIYGFFEVRAHRKMRLSVTDGCVIAYLIMTCVSVLSGGFYQDALWGYYGWNMGLMSQVSFVFLYFFLSRFAKYYRMILTILCGTSCIVYAIGILHRLMIDPIGFYDGLEYSQKAQFLSTLGQASWYGSFLTVTLPIGIGVVLYTHEKIWRVLGCIYTVLGFCTLVTQNSDSAYFGLAGALLVFFIISAGERETMCRFTGVLTLLFASGKIMYYLMQINPNPKLEPDFVTKIMWTSGVTWALLIMCLAMTIVLHLMGNKERGLVYPAALMGKMRKIIPLLMVMAIAGIVVLIVLQTRGLLPERISGRLKDVSYFNWNDNWGNGRGRIWQFSVKIFSEENLGHKLFGVGPDCFSSYLNAYYREEEALLWGEKQLTNAHNEWLNILINGGVVGAAAYIGIYVTAIGRFMRNHRKDILLAGVAASCISYMCYNFFCYQQVLCTPFIFILMGVGEYIVRQRSERR
ncbi:MAG: O-antigen ligase family protein [Lachnospiraceae bacterium]|nr:O-antigen ligase family protein [Lachnospiraceae bacterium]